MLVLNHVVKDYVTGDTTVRALDDVSLAFRKSEFVSVLGHSGCGKTTMLNIIGGLDKYTSGVMSIKGITTEEYKDSDWDTYRNHSIGFVFQSYNLIPHQTVLANVELALTLSGVSKAERRKRATEVLEKVGLGDQLHKKPSQMSGGQMQRVAIARALVNDPEILLADEPTGALDTDTSVQIMDILKEISKDKLIIMVTHNPELAEKYSDRIIRLSDGKVIGDTNPFDFADEAKEVEVIKAAEAEAEAADEVTEVDKNKKKKKKPSMSFITALTLSFNNLLTKKTRTFLTSFAGSIGIIGIALILSLSNGINAFIDRVQRETLSSYPITIQKEEIDMSAMIAGLMAQNKPIENPDPNKVYVNPVTYGMLTSMLNPHTQQNNLEKLKEHIESSGSKFKDHTQVIKYGYGVTINPYLIDSSNNYYKADVNDLFTEMMDRLGMSYGNSSSMSGMMTYGNTVWQEMLPPDENSDDLMHGMIKEQYDLIAGSWPKDKSEVLLVVSGDNAITDLALYSLGLYSADEIFQIVVDAANGIETDTNISYTFDELIYTGKEDTKFVSYKIIPSSDYYYFKDTDGDKTPDKWVDLRNDGTATELNGVISGGLDLKISGIIRQNPEATAGSLSGTLVYTSALTEYLLNEIASSAIVTAQNADTSKDVFTGLPFKQTVFIADENKPAAFKSYLNTATVAKKAEIYKSILTTPDEDDVKQKAMEYLVSLDVEANKNNKEKLLQIIINYAGQENEELASKYFANLTAEQLYAYIYDFALTVVRENYTAAAQSSIDAIVNTPNDSELEAQRMLSALQMVYRYDTTQSKAKIKAWGQMIVSSSPDFFENVDISTMSPETVLEMLCTVMEQMGDNGMLSTGQSLINSIMLATDPYGNPISTHYGLDSAVQRQFLIDYYTALTGFDSNEINSMLGTDGQVNSRYLVVLENIANESYKNTKAAGQSEASKNEKLAAALDKAIKANQFENSELTEFYDRYVPVKSPTTLEENFELIGVANKNDPDSIMIYANSFEDKEAIAELIEQYNKKQKEEDKISYTDYVGLIMSSVTSIIDAITYVLIFFVSISLVVSSIMIGIITYISVLERTKEIGILRAIGASKRDVSRVFNAETLIVGFASGMIGIIITVLLNIPITLIIKHLSGISGLSTLPVMGGVILVLISMGLTVFAGLIPSGIAAKKDPVESLRSE